MMADQTPTSQPTDSGKGGGPKAPKRRRHIPSDVIQHRSASAAPRADMPHHAAVTEPPATPVEPHPTAHHGTSRFNANEWRPAQSSQSAQPAQSAQPIQPTAHPRQPKPFASSVPAQPALPARLAIDAAFERTRLLLLAAIMVPLCIWASFPAWESMVYEWYHTDDYSHGFLVIPATILFLYMRWDTYPGTRYRLDWVGLFPIFLYGVFRIFAGLRYLEPLDMIAIWFWILSIVWFFYGWRVFLWALPALCFLIFMFQLPWRIDVLMKNQLQFFAAQFAAVLLQIVGEAAVPIKNTIRLSSIELGVEAACSGLRFLMSVFAIAFAAVLLLRRPWWQNILIIAVAAPLALFVNAFRIALTGILLEHHYDMVTGWTAEGQSIPGVADAFAGKIAIVLALGLFALFVWYLGKIFRRIEI